MSLHSINTDQRLYTLAHGNGYTCLGFDYAFNTATKVAEWCGVPAPATINVGTSDGYQDYERIMHQGADYARVTSKRCPAELIPAFVGKEGQRVKVTDSDGNVRRFYIGRSTGWLPHHLEISRRDSLGGISAHISPSDTITFTGTRL